MKRLGIVWLLTVAVLAAAETAPRYALEAENLVTDLHYEKGRLYAATYGGSVEVFDTASRERTGRVTLPNIKDFMGDEVPPRIYAIDRRGETLMMISEGKSGYRNVYLHDGKRLKKVIDSSRQLMIKKGLFVDENHLLLGLLSSEIILYRIDTDTILYRHPIKARRSGGSAFSDMALSEDAARVATADESGEVNLFNVADFRQLGVLKGQNVDNVYRVDYKNGTVITAGQDRRCGVYRPDGTAYHMDAAFLIYAAALSPSGATGVYAATIDNDLQLFDTASRTKGALLKGHDATISDIVFVGERALFSAAEERRILFWDLDDHP